MKGYKFYAEYTDGTRTVPDGNVLAIEPDTGRETVWGAYVYDAVGTVYALPYAPVASTSVAQQYLDVRCREVTEAEARRIHPALFQFLDGNDTVPQATTK